MTRYDTCHGRLHIHRFWRSAGDQVQELSPNADITDYAQAAKEARLDIDRNWHNDRTRMEAKHGSS